MKFHFCLNSLSKNKVERLLYEDPIERMKNAGAEVVVGGLNMVSVGMKVSGKIFSTLANGSLRGIEYLEDIAHKDPIPHKDVPTASVDPNKRPRNQGELADAIIVLNSWEEAYRNDVLKVGKILDPFSEAFGVLEKIYANDTGTVERNNIRIRGLQERKVKLRAANSRETLMQEEFTRIQNNVTAEIKTIYKRLYELQTKWNHAKTAMDAARASGDHVTADRKFKEMDIYKAQFDETKKGIKIATDSGKHAKKQLLTKSPGMKEIELIDQQIAALTKSSSDTSGKKYKLDGPELAKFKLIDRLFAEGKITADEGKALEQEEGTSGEMMAVINPYLQALKKEKQTFLDEAGRCIDRKNLISQLQSELPW